MLFRVLGLAGVILLIGIGFSVLQATARSSATADLETTEPVRTADVEIDSGPVRLRARGRTGAEIATRSEYFLRRPTVTTDVVDEELRVRSNCDWPAGCEIAVDGRVPAETDFRVRTAGGGGVHVDGDPGAVSVGAAAGDVTVLGARRDVNVGTRSGDVLVEGAQRAVRAESLSGEVVLRDLVGPIRARTASGFVTGERLRADEVEVESGSARVRLDFAVPPERLEIDVTEGVVEIEVPAGAYRLDLDLGIGEEQIEGVTDDPDSSRRIIVRVSEGIARITGR